MAAAFVKALFSNRNSSAGNTLSLTGSAVVSAGNTIFVGIGAQEKSATGWTVTDNLGNTYTQVINGSASTVCGCRLFRGDVTKPGTLTTITVGAPSSVIMGAMAAEFSGVGAVRGTGSILEDNNTFTNVYPGGSANTFAQYLAGDLWIGVAATRGSTFTFTPASGGQNAACVEPSQEQAGTGLSVGWLYLTDTVNSSGTVRIAGTWSAFAANAGAGAAFQAAATAIVYNDAPAGAIVFTGSRTESWVKRFTDAPAGAVVLVGTSTERKLVSDAASGAMALTGSAVDSYSHGFTDARAGTLTLSGTCVTKRARSDAPSGAVALSGSVVESWIVKTGYTDAPAGAIALSGAVTDRRVGADRPTGRLAIGGTVVESAVFTQAVTGRVRVWGWAAEPLPVTIPRPVGIPGDLAQMVGLGTDPATLRIDVGWGWDIGDVLICFITAWGGSALQVGSVPVGWKTGIAYFGANPEFYLLGKVVDRLDEPPLTLTFTVPGAGTASVGPIGARVVAFRGLDTRNLDTIADVVGATSAATVATPSAGGAAIQTIRDNDLVLSLTERVLGGAVTRLTPPAGFSMVTWDSPVTQSSANRLLIGWAYQVKHPPGAVPASSFAVSTSDGTAYESRGVQLGLKAALVTEESVAPTGTLRLSGSCVEKRGRVDAPQGSLSLNGSATDKYLPPTVDGILPLSGTVQESYSHASALAGSLRLSGTLVERYDFSDITTGSIPVSGTAQDSKRTADVCAGVLRLIGVVSESHVVVDYVSGTLRLRGLASEFITIDGKIFYDDYPAGLLDLEGRTIFVDESVTPGRDGRIVEGLENGRIVEGLKIGRVVRNLTGRLLS